MTVLLPGCDHLADGMGHQNHQSEGPAAVEIGPDREERNEPTDGARVTTAEEEHEDGEQQ
jgi:hypothetical protein